MDFTQWSQLALICVMGAMSPGPSLAVILRNTISGGRTQGLMSGVGHGLGITFYSVVAITGLVALLKTVPNFFLIAQIIGSLFLILLGGKMIISSIGGKQNNGELKQSTITEYRGFSGTKPSRTVQRELLGKYPHKSPQKVSWPLLRDSQKFSIFDESKTE